MVRVRLSSNNSKHPSGMLSIQLNKLLQRPWSKPNKSLSKACLSFATTSLTAGTPKQQMTKQEWNQRSRHPWHWTTSTLTMTVKPCPMSSYTTNSRRGKLCLILTKWSMPIGRASSRIPTIITMASKTVPIILESIFKVSSSNSHTNNSVSRNYLSLRYPTCENPGPKTKRISTRSLLQDKWCSRRLSSDSTGVIHTCLTRGSHWWLHLTKGCLK